MSSDETSNSSSRGTREQDRSPLSELAKHPLVLVIAAGLFGSGGLLTAFVQHAGNSESTSSASPVTVTAATTITATVTASPALGGDSSSANADATTVPVGGAAANSAYTVQWGPHPLNLGQVDLQGNPPVVSAPGGLSDISTYRRTADGRAELAASSGAHVAVWTGEQDPTPAECEDLATTVPVARPPVAAGDSACVWMEDNSHQISVALLDITEVTGHSSSDGQVVATVTVWRKN